MFFLDEFKDYLLRKNYFHPMLTNRIIEGITRKLMKTLLMPLVYGKTVVAMSNDIRDHFTSSSTSLSNKECMDLSKYCLEFWIFKTWYFPSNDYYTKYRLVSFQVGIPGILFHLSLYYYTRLHAN